MRVVEVEILGRNIGVASFLSCQNQACFWSLLKGFWPESHPEDQQVWRGASSQLKKPRVKPVDLRDVTKAKNLSEVA